MDSIGRHEQLLRVCHLLEVLQAARRPLSVGEIKEHLQARGVIEDLSDRTLRRDLGFLAGFGYPVRSRRAAANDGRPRVTWQLDGGRDGEGLAVPPISLPELLALAAAREFLTPLAGTIYWRGIASLLARVERLATPALLAYADTHRDGLVVHPRVPAGRYRPRLLAAINRSIRNRLELEIRYHGQGDPRPARRVIQPEALVMYDGVLYVAAHPGGKAATGTPGLRFFKLDRLAAARVGRRTFAARETSVADALADSITIYRSAVTAPRPYRLRVAPARARWACEKPFHPRQRVTRGADGSVVLDIARAWDDEMLPQLLALGECVEVLEPVAMRDRLAATAEQIATIHRGGGSRPRGDRNGKRR